MNIFVLSRNPKIAAQYHCDKHVIKMISESYQMLMIPEKQLERQHSGEDYSIGHEYHPCSVWARTTRGNYLWLAALMQHLLEEYDKHWPSASQSKYINARTFLLLLDRDYMDSINLPFNYQMTEFVQAMPDYCKHSDVVSAYWKYYNNEKTHLYSWRRGRVVPPFVPRR